MSSAFCKTSVRFNRQLDHRLISLSLELPEDTLVNIHNYDATGETYGKLEPIVPFLVRLSTRQ